LNGGSSSIAVKASTVWLPETSDCLTVFEFLCDKFSKIDRGTWESRMERGKITFENGDKVLADTPYKPSCRVLYYRELAQETPVPFKEKILYEDENILVADKPHFLTLHPVGQYINETLLNRLKITTGNDELLGAHRIDRLTAGLVLFSKNKESRGRYQKMFVDKVISKTYEAIGRLPADNETKWSVKNRMIAAEDPWFLMKVGTGEPNTESEISLIEKNDQLGKFELKPVTGKKHQLRLHMCCIGSSILNDPFYPDFKKDAEDDYENPLQLLARKLAFTDPLTGKEMSFESKLKLRF
jgi:tRNA pseudouridine32 synthase/23S rRNA pseudouridine746 synthase